jgi:HK97 family phage major capsid protein
MNPRLAKYQQKATEIRGQMETILAAAEAADGVLTPEQDTAYKALDGQLKASNEAIERERAHIEAERTAPAVQRAGRITVRNRAEDHPTRGFTTPREFILAVYNAEQSGAMAREDLTDERLRPIAIQDSENGKGLAIVMPQAFTPISLRGDAGMTERAFQAAAGSDEQGSYDDSYGGFAVRPSYRPGMLALGFEGDPTAARTLPVPMATPTVKMLARTDKNHASSVSGGFLVYRRPEAAAITPSRMQMEEIMLHAESLVGAAYATEELLTDSVISFVAIIEAGFRDQFAHKILSEKLRGLGGSQLLGILTALDASSLGPTVAVTRTTTSTLDALDVVNMRAQCWGFDQAIWIANHDCYPNLSKAAIVVLSGSTPAGIVSIYQPSLQEGRPDMLLGRPIFYSEYASTLGSAGDLILGNWSQYLEGLYQPLQSAESVHVRFLNHERTFKFWLRNCGAPWWRTALTPNQSTTKLSPFVVVAA